MTKPLNDMVASVTKQKTLSWIQDGRIVFERLKTLVNDSPKLYFIDYNLPVILYTDASDYAQGIYLCQLRTLPVPVSRPYGSWVTPFRDQVRWSTIEKEFYAIY